MSTGARLLPDDLKIDAKDTELGAVIAGAAGRADRCQLFGKPV